MLKMAVAKAMQAHIEENVDQLESLEAREREREPMRDVTGSGSPSLRAPVSSSRQPYLPPRDSACLCKPACALLQDAACFFKRAAPCCPCPSASPFLAPVGSALLLLPPSPPPSPLPSVQPQPLLCPPRWPASWLGGAALRSWARVALRAYRFVCLCVCVVL